MLHSRLYAYLPFFRLSGLLQKGVVARRQGDGWHVMVRRCQWLPSGPSGLYCMACIFEMVARVSFRLVVMACWRALDTSSAEQPRGMHAPAQHCPALQRATRCSEARVQRMPTPRSLSPLQVKVYISAAVGVIDTGDDTQQVPRSTKRWK